MQDAAAKGHLSLVDHILAVDYRDVSAESVINDLEKALDAAVKARTWDAVEHIASHLKELDSLRNCDAVAHDKISHPIKVRGRPAYRSVPFHELEELSGMITTSPPLPDHLAVMIEYGAHAITLKTTGEIAHMDVYRRLPDLLTMAHMAAGHLRGYHRTSGEVDGLAVFAVRLGLHPLPW